MTYFNVFILKEKQLKMHFFNVFLVPKNLQIKIHFTCFKKNELLRLKKQF